MKFSLRFHLLWAPFSALFGMLTKNRLQNSWRSWAGAAMNSPITSRGGLTMVSGYLFLSSQVYEHDQAHKFPRKLFHVRIFSKRSNQKPLHWADRSAQVLLLGLVAGRGFKLREKRKSAIIKSSNFLLIPQVKLNGKDKSKLAQVFKPSSCILGKKWQRKKKLVILSFKTGCLTTMMMIFEFFQI